MHNRTWLIRAGFVVLACVVSLLPGTEALSAPGQIENSTHYQTRAVPRQGPEAGFKSAPGMVIIRLREKEPLASVYQTRYGERKAGYDETLNRLKNQYRLRNERPVFQTIHERFQADNLNQDEFERATNAAVAANKRPLPDQRKSVDLLPVYALRTNRDIGETLTALALDPDVEYVEPNFLATTSFLPNDPFYPSQWAHRNTQAESGWDSELGERSVIVAVVDSGVDYRHEDLAPNIWRDRKRKPGADFVDIVTSDYDNGYYGLLPDEDYVTFDNDPADYLGHGTHVGGIIGAKGNNGVGVSGVCPNCTIMPVRAGFAIQTPSGVVGMLEYDDIANAITYAAENGAAIINMSFGGDQDSPTLKSAIDFADSLGVVLVAAAGNNASGDIFYPAGYANVIAVAATASNDSKAYYSNYGVWVDVAAPGGDSMQDAMTIYSTVPKTGILSDPSGYRSLQGTSMASPYVAGTAGLLLSKNSALSSGQVKKIMLSSVDTPTADVYIGTGRVNVFKALQVNNPPLAVAEISSPRTGAELPVSPTAIIGTATGNSYRLEIAAEPYPAAWTPVATGTTPVVDGVLGTLYATGLGLATEREYYVRLTVFDTIAVRSIIATLIYKRLHPGWPQSTGSAPIVASPVLYDLDFDGTLEIVLPTYGAEPNTYGSGTLHVWRSDGSPYPGWPVQTGGPLPAAAAVGDLDGDCSAEIVVGSWSGIYVFNLDGTNHAGWPKSNYTSHAPALADLDGDGRKEIVIPADSANGTTARLYAWRHDGTLLPGWPVDLAGASPAAVADIDGDGVPEIVSGTSGVDYSRYATEPKAVYVYRADGTPLPNWPQPTTGWVWAGPVIGDIDNDGDNEIVAVTPSGVYAWHHDGSSVASFPLSVSDVSAHTPPILVDIDQDGDLEIVISRFSGVDVYHHTGQTASGWPALVYAGGQSTAADIDGDGGIEIVTKGRDKLMAWHHDGKPVDDFPIPVSDHSHSGTTEPFPAIGDVDNDGKLEIVHAANTDRVLMFDLDGAADPLKLAWPMSRHDAWNTGTAQKFALRDPPPADEVCDGVDNNCNGQIDEGLPLGTFYPDADSDMFGNPLEAIQACFLPAGYVADGTDCNDANAAVHPGAAEICGDGLDNNCNGAVDEGCSVAVVAPNGGEVIASGGTYTIAWGAPSTAVKFDLSYSLNNGKSWTTIATKVTGYGNQYQWSVPKPTANSTQCLVKIVGFAANGSVVGSDVSDSNFTIEVVRLTAPSGGEDFRRSVTPSTTIAWSTNGTSKSVTKVTISYSTNGGGRWTKIKDLATNPGSYTWSLPATNSTQYRVLVALYNGSSLLGSDGSDSNFTVRP